MILEFNMKHISLNVAGVMNDVKPYLISAMDEAEEKLIHYMDEEIDQSLSNPAHWRDKLHADLQHISEEITESYIYYETGLPYKSGWPWLRAMVVAFGNLPPIYTQPGQVVWNNDLNGLHRSNAYSEHEIPASWYHSGHEFIQNAMLEMRAEYESILEGAIGTIPSSVFANNIIVR